MAPRTPGELDGAPCAPRKLFLEPGVLTFLARSSHSVSPTLGPLPCTPLLPRQPQLLLSALTTPGLDFPFHLRMGRAEVGSAGNVHPAQSRGKRGGVESPGDCDGGAGSLVCVQKRKNRPLPPTSFCVQQRLSHQWDRSLFWIPRCLSFLVGGLYLP